MTDCPAAINYQGEHIPCTEGALGHGVIVSGLPAHSNAEHQMIWIGDEPGRLPVPVEVGLKPELMDTATEPVTVDELWDATVSPELVADYVPALDGSAAVVGPSDAHPELRLARADDADLEARLTAIVGQVDGEAYVSRIVSALISAGVRFHD